MLFVEELGHGEAVVLLHGTPTTPDHLRPLAERLARRWRTLLVHLPGYGRSEPLAPYDLERSHELVEDALQDRGVHSAHFLGHSGGAYRAFAHATRARIRPRSVVALGAVSHFPKATQEGFAALSTMLRKGTDLGPMFPDLMLGPGAKAELASVREVMSWATASAPDHLASELDAFACAPDLRPMIAALAVPILLRVGALDTATPAERSEDVARVAKHAVLQIIEGAGHALLLEDLDGTARAVEDHLLRSKD